MTHRIPLDDLTSDQLDALYDQLDAAEETETQRQLAVMEEAFASATSRAARAQAALTRARDACNQLHRAAVLADGQPHTDRERGIVQAVTRVRAALDQPETTPGCGHCGHPADWHDEYEGCVGPYGIGEPGSGDCTCTRSPDTASAPAATEATSIDEVQQLRAELAALREVARGYCPHCGRGDASPTAQQWEEQKLRADQAEDLLRIAHDTSNRSEAERARAVQRAEAAEARVADYEHRITWHTTCANCAHLLDSSIRETDRAERADRALARVRDLAARIRAGAAPRNLDDLADRIEQAAATEATPTIRDRHRET